MVVYQFQLNIVVGGLKARAGDCWPEEKFPSGTLESCLRCGHVVATEMPVSDEPVPVPVADEAPQEMPVSDEPVKEPGEPEQSESPLGLLDSI